MILVDDNIRRGPGVLVLHVLTEGPHPPPQLPVGYRQALGDDQLRRDLGGDHCDLLGVPEDPHSLEPVHRHAVHLRAPLVHRLLRPVGGIQGIPAHGVQALSGLLRAFEVPSGPLLIGDGEPPHPRVLVHPPIDAPQVEDLPVLEPDGLSRLRPPALVAQAEPPQNPVRPGGVEYPGEILVPDSSQIVEMPLTRRDFVGTAQLPEPPLGHLLCVHRHRMVQAALPSLRHINPKSGPGPYPPGREPGPSSPGTAPPSPG